jgi:hypothetical protein
MWGGGTSPCLSIPVLDPSLVESVVVEGPCELTTEGKVIRSPHHRACISHIVGALNGRTSSGHLKDVREESLVSSG